MPKKDARKTANPYKRRYRPTLDAKGKGSNPPGSTNIKTPTVLGWFFFACFPSVGAVSGGFLLSTALPKSSVSANFPPFFYLCSPFAS